MPKIHNTSTVKVSYTYYEPKPNDKGTIKGIMYEKLIRKPAIRNLKVAATR